MNLSLMRRCARVLAATLAVLSLAGNAAAENLKLGHITPPTHVWHLVGERIADGLKSASGGKYTVAVSPLQKLGNEAQMINLMQAGALQFGIFTASGLANREPSFLAWSLPYTFKDVTDASRAADTPAAKEMLKRLEVQGMVGLGYAFAGMRHVLSLEPVHRPQDLAGRKIRAFPSPIYNDWWQAAGAAPTALPLSEVAPSLTTKLLDAVDIDLDALVGLKLDQQAPNLSLTNHMAFPAVIVVSKKFWDSRSDADRAMIRKVVDEAAHWGYQQAAAAEASNLAKAKADGAKVIDVDLPAFEALAAPIRDKYMAQNPLIAAFYKQAKGL